MDRFTYHTHPEEDGGGHHGGQRERQDVIDKIELVSSESHFRFLFPYLL